MELFIQGLPPTILLRATDSLPHIVSLTLTLIRSLLPDHSLVTIVVLEPRDTPLHSRNRVIECSLVHSLRVALSLPTLLVACRPIRILPSLQQLLVSTPQTLVPGHLPDHSPEIPLLLSTNLLALPLIPLKELEVTKRHLTPTSPLQATLTVVPPWIPSLVNPPLIAVPARDLT